MVLDDPKPLKSIGKQILFLILGHSKKKNQKRTLKGSSKVMFLDPNGDMGIPGSIYRLIFVFCCDAKKSLFLDAFPMDQKIEKSSLGAPKARKKPPGRQQHHG